MARGPDALVIGGGLLGLVCARALAAGGARALVLERNPAPGTEASRAAAGLLVPETERAAGRLAAADEEAESALRELLHASLARYPDFVREIEAASGRTVHYRPDGSLLVARSETEAEALAAWARRDDARANVEWLAAAAARRLEPALDPAIAGALHVPGDHQVDNVELTRAAADAASGTPGVAIRTSAHVVAIEARDGRVRGVFLAGGERIGAAVVVLAAGAWSAKLEGLPRPVPVRPVKGQMVALGFPPPAPIRRIVSVAGAYSVPRDDGRVLVGATVEEAGFDPSLDDRAAAELVRLAARAVPAFERAPIVSHWAGFRPATPDGLPLLGPDPDLLGLLYATGHFRNGILLAPITAEIVEAWTRGGPPPVDLGPFAPDRSTLAGHRESR